MIVKRGSRTQERNMSTNVPSYSSAPDAMSWAGNRTEEINNEPGVAEVVVVFSI